MPHKTTLNSKVVKINSKIIISLQLSKSMTHFVAVVAVAVVAVVVVAVAIVIK